MRPKRLHVEWSESRLLLEARMDSYNRLSRALFGHDHHWNLLLAGGRGYGKRATLETLRARAAMRSVSAIPETKLLTLDHKTVVWRCIRPAFLTDPVGVARARAILDRKRGRNGASYPKVPETAGESGSNRV